MSTSHESQRHGRRQLVSVVAIGLLVLFAISTLFALSAARTTAKATDQAKQLVAELEKAGKPAPSVDSIVRVLGDDGGAVCDDPNTALARATAPAEPTPANLGVRPAATPDQVVQGQILIMQVYCPGQVADFKAHVDGLHLGTSSGT